MSPRLFANCTVRAVNASSITSHKSIIKHDKNDGDTSYSSSCRIVTEKNNLANNWVCICETCDQTLVLRQALQQLGYGVTNDVKHCDVFWTLRFPEVTFCRNMKRFQRVNHFSGMYEICRKDLLARNLLYMRKCHPEQYNFFPQSWVFPYEFSAAIDFSRAHANAIFILKPVTGSMGRGIEITRTLKESMRFERIVCQLYVMEPLLLDGFKFDLRIYVLVTSVDPLQIYVYNEGLVRLATRQYDYPKKSNIDNKFMHLTNFSINKYSASYSPDAKSGSKRFLKSFNTLLADEGHDLHKLWNDIDDIIMKTVVTILPELQHGYRTLFPNHDRISACFEILGFDIIIDHMLRPFLLEVNQSPSFNVSTHVDDTVKTNLIRDTLILLNISNDYRKHVLRQERQRAFCKNQNIKRSSFIGDHQDDVDIGQFRKLDSEKYSELIASANHPSFYNDTIMSKARITFGQEKRREFDQSNKLNGSARSRDRCDIRCGPDYAPVVARKKNKIIFIGNTNYMPKTICQKDERRRIMDLVKRDVLIRNSGIVQLFCNTFRVQLN